MLNVLPKFRLGMLIYIMLKKTCIWQNKVGVYKKGSFLTQTL